MARACSNTMKFGSAAILIAMVMAIVVNSNVVAASRQYPGGRSLLQSHGALLIDYMGASGATSLQFSDLQATVTVTAKTSTGTILQALPTGSTMRCHRSAAWCRLTIWMKSTSITRTSLQAVLLSPLASAS